MSKTVPDEPFKSGLEFLKAVLIGQGFWKNSGAVERVDTLLSMLAAAPASSEGQGTADGLTEAEIKDIRVCAALTIPPYRRWKEHGRISGDDPQLHEFYKLATPSVIAELCALALDGLKHRRKLREGPVAMELKDFAEQRAADLEKALLELRSAKAACFPSSAAAQNAWIERIDNAERMADEALNGGVK